MFVFVKKIYLFVLHYLYTRTFVLLKFFSILSKQTYSDKIEVVLYDVSIFVLIYHEVDLTLELT